MHVLDWVPCWLTPSWWAYMLRRPDSPNWGASWLERFACRWQGHPAGPVFYNVGGLEPDDRCKSCGDYC
jgi:hypothetical protein